jgi:hypothetical protein
LQRLPKTSQSDWVGQIGFRLFMGAQSMMHGLGGKVARLK